MDGALHGTACSPYMAPSSKEGSNPGYIDTFIGTHTYLILQQICLIQKYRAVHALDIPELVDNAVQIGRRYMIKLHHLFADAAHNTPALHETDALHQCPSQNLVLQICLLIKTFLYDFGKRKPESNQPGRYL